MEKDLKKRPGRRRIPRGQTAVEARNETDEHNDLMPAEVASLREFFELLDEWDRKARGDELL